MGLIELPLLWAQHSPIPETYHGCRMSGTVSSAVRAVSFVRSPAHLLRGPLQGLAAKRGLLLLSAPRRERRYLRRAEDLSGRPPRPPNISDTQLQSNSTWQLNTALVNVEFV